MHTPPQFAAAARARRTQAFLLTVFLFLVALAALSYADSGSLLPAFLRSLLDGSDLPAETVGV